jgi:ATP-dependent DNA helicase 2 subunit 2
MNEDEDEVEKEDRIKGYRYGRTIVPWVPGTDERLSLQPDKCLSVICFAPSRNVSPRVLM